MEELNQIKFLYRLDWDIVVFIIMMAGLTVGFIYRKQGSKSKILSYIYIALAYIENLARNFRDRHWPKNKRNI